MHEKVGRPQIAERQVAIEFQMLRRQMLDGVVELALADAVTVHRRRAAIEEERFAVMPGQAEKGQHHVLMIALERDDLRRSLLQVHDDLDRIARRGSAIDIIADEYDRVVLGRRDRLDDGSQLGGASMNVADREQPSLMFLLVAKHSSRGFR